jgi:hypothetical protein
MSIVKQIVDNSGGSIDIHSELGIGTVVKLSLPIEDHLSQAQDTSAGQASEQELENPIQAIRRRAKGRSVTIRGFDSSAENVDDLQSQALASLKASIEKYVTNWFDLTIARNETETSAPADIVISDESVFLDSARSPRNEFTSPGRSLLILCSNGSRREIYSTRMNTNHVIEFVSKPCGPHRLAKALLNCLDKEDVISKAEFSKVSLPLFSVVPASLSNDVFPNNKWKHSPSEVQRTVFSSAVAENTTFGTGLGIISDLQTSIEYAPHITCLNRVPESLSGSDSNITSDSRSGLNLASSTSSRDAHMIDQDDVESIYRDKDEQDPITSIKRDFDLSNIPEIRLPLTGTGNRNLRRPKMLLVEV